MRPGCAALSLASVLAVLGAQAACAAPASAHVGPASAHSTLASAHSAPASAHSGPVAAQRHVSTVTAIEPALPGVRAAMVNNGTQLELHNAGPGPLTVLPDAAEPEPHTVGAGATLRYEDARTIPSPGSTADRTWRVPIQTPAGHGAVVGRLEFPPPPNPVPWLLLAGVLGAAGYLVGRSRGWWAPGLAVGLAAVTAAGIAHAVGSARAVSGQSPVALAIGASGIGLVCWPLAVFAIAAALRRRPGGALLAALVGAGVAFAGLADVNSFRYAQPAFAGPPDLARLLATVVVGAGIGLAAGGFVVLRRDLPAEPPGPA